MKNSVRLVVLSVVLVLFFGLVLQDRLGAQQSAIQNLTFVPAVPPGGVGGACTATTYGYITPTGQVVTCVSSVWVAAATTTGGAPPTGTAGGSLGGTYPNPTLSGVTVASGLFAPTADSATSIQVKSLAAALIMNFDTTQGFVGIGPNTTLTAPLHVFRNVAGDMATFQNTNTGTRLKVGSDNATGVGTFQVRNTADSVNLALAFQAAGGNVLIGKSTNGTSTLDVVGNITASTSVSGATHLTASNCTSSAAPAVCASAAAGSVVIPALGTTVTVNTTAVTANSQIFVMFDSSLGTKLSVTCNTTEPALYGITARTAATSFVITSSAIAATNPGCFSYFIVN